MCICYECVRLRACVFVCRDWCMHVCVRICMCKYLCIHFYLLVHVYVYIRILGDMYLNAPYRDKNVLWINI